MNDMKFTNNIKNEFIKIRNSTNGNNEIEISGEIGQSWFSNGYTFDKFKNDLNGMSGKIIINIKSMGGDLMEAFAIYDHIRSLSNKVITKIVGSSASAATIISLAGDRRYITQNSRYLIHKPMMSTMGNSDDFEKTLNQLKDFDKQIIDLYVKRTKLNAEEVIKLMSEEKFISAAEAIEMGFIDDYVKDKDYVNPDNNDNNKKNNDDMNKEILNMLGVTNDAEAKEKIVQLINKVEKEEEETTENQATDESASEEVEKEKTQASEKEEETTENQATDESASEEVEKEEEVENESDENDADEEKEEDEESIDDLKAKIKALEKELEEKKKKDAENKLQNFINFLNDATKKGKISNASHRDWINIYNRDGEDFARKLVNNIPAKDNTVDKVINSINQSTNNLKTKDSIINDWKSGIIDGATADILLKQIK